MSLLSIEMVAFSLMGYSVSYLELVATFFGMLSVYLAARANIWTWPTGIINEWGFFLLFYQINVYADMLLQCVFFVMTIYGWYAWFKPKNTIAIHYLGVRLFIGVLLLIIVLALLLGVAVQNIHHYLPTLFSESAAYPFVDSFVAVISIVALALMTKKCMEAWILWITVDVLSVGLFLARDVYLVAIEFFVFLLMAIYGYLNWRRQVVR